jgi:hypothetical protein
MDMKERYDKIMELRKKYPKMEVAMELGFHYNASTVIWSTDMEFAEHLKVMERLASQL